MRLHSASRVPTCTLRSEQNKRSGDPVKAIQLLSTQLRSMTALVPTQHPHIPATMPKGKTYTPYTPFKLPYINVLKHCPDYLHAAYAYPPITRAPDYACQTSGTFPLQSQTALQRLKPRYLNNHQLTQTRPRTLTPPRPIPRSTSRKSTPRWRAIASYQQGPCLQKM
jgi:hypothetical protein